MVSLENIYKELGIEPYFYCKYSINYKCINSHSTNYEKACDGECEICDDYIPSPDYPKVDDLSDYYLNMLVDIMANGRCISYICNKKEEKPYIFTCEHYKGIGWTKCEAIFSLLENMLKGESFSKEEKDEIFYIVSYIGW